MKKLLVLVLIIGACSHTKPQPEPSPTPIPTATPSPTPTPTPSSPPPKKQLLFGYYFADGKYGDYREEVDCYTNLYYAVTKSQYGGSDAPDDEWLASMKQHVKSAYKAGKRIDLNMSLTDNSIPVDLVLNIMRPYWDAVDLIELADEPSWSKSQAESQIDAFKVKLQTNNLSIPPIGITFTQNQVLNENTISANGLDYVGIEAYSNPPGSDDSQTNVDQLNKFLRNASARVPESKKLVIVTQAYDRNGAWKNIDTLKVLQDVPYAFAKNDSRVIAITLFAYARPGGSKFYPLLKSRHIKIGNDILRKACK